MNSPFRLLLLCVFACVVFCACEKKSSEIKIPQEKGPKWGFIDHSGKFVIKPKFRRVKSFHEGLAAADMHARWGFIDREGNWVIQRAYEDVKDFSAGYAPVQKGGKWGVIDRKGRLKLKCEYADIGRAHEVNPDAEDHAVVIPVKMDKLWGFKDMGPLGHGDIREAFSEVKYFNDGLCPVRQKPWGDQPMRWGFVNAKGELLKGEKNGYRYDSATVFQERIAECMMADDFVWVDQIGTEATKSRLESRQLFSEEMALQERNGKFVYINRRGKRAFRKKFRFADNFSEGLAVVQPLRSTKKGFIDNRGHLVINDIYDDARAFSEQLAAVKVDPDEFFKIYNEDGTPKETNDTKSSDKKKRKSGDDDAKDDKKKSDDGDAKSKDDKKKSDDDNAKSKDEKKKSDDDDAKSKDDKKKSNDSDAKSKDKKKSDDSDAKSKDKKKSDDSDAKSKDEKKKSDDSDAKSKDKKKKSDDDDTKSKDKKKTKSDD